VLCFLVVAASLIVVVSFYGGRIGNDIALGGRPMPIRFSTDWDNSTGQIKVTVVNRADEETTLTEIYVNGILDDKAANVPQVLLPHQEVEITLSATYMVMPIQITIKIHTENYNFSVYGPITFIEFEMLRVYWDESTGRIRVLVENTGEYPEVNFGEIYVNGTLDDAAVITRVYSETYEIVSSKTYINCPSQVTIKVITDFGAFCETTDGDLMKNPYG